MKRNTQKAALLCGCLLLMMLTLVGCGSASSIPVSSAASDNSSNQESPKAASQDPSVPAESEIVDTDYDSQLQLIAGNVAVWLGDTELTAEPYFYAVTDLDQNGRLEIIQSSCQGTGIYTYSYLWEVSTDGTELVPIEFSISEEESQPDIITDPDNVYYDEADDCYFYLFYDDIRNGAAEYYQSRIAVSLKDGEITATLLGQSHSIYSSSSDVVTTYTDTNGNAIGESDYNTATDKAFAGLKSMQATIGWTDADLSEQMAALSGEEIENMLKTSWEGFSLR